MKLEIIASQLKGLQQAELPGIEAHKKMLPQGRGLTDDYLKNISNYKQSAVFALMFEEDAQINLLLTQRHQYEGKHSGQISFPGGKKEDFDESLFHTALRETYEEVGIASDAIEYITMLSPLYIPVSNFLVQPFLGYLKSLPELTLNTREVKSIVKFPLKALHDPTMVKIKKIEATSGLHLTVPAFELDNHTIWGATAMMLREIGDLIKEQGV